MIRKITLSALFLAFMVSGFAQAKIDMTFKNVKELEVAGIVVVNVYPSESDEVRISGNTTTIASNQLSFKDKKGTLTIERKLPVSAKKNEIDSIVLDMYIKNPNTIFADSKSELYFSELFEFEEFNIEVANGSSVAVIVNAPTCNIETKSSGKLLLSGNIKDINIKATSKSYVNTIQTQCETLNAVVNTNAEAYVRADKILNLKVATWGNIFHKGIAEEIIKNISTGGHIEKF